MPDATPALMLLVDPNCAIEQTVALLFGRYAEQWVDARLDRSLAQQVTAKSMDRADPRHFEFFERVFEAMPCGTSRIFGNSSPFDLWIVNN